MRRQASIHNVLVAHEQNMMIRRAILATGSSREFEQMRKVYSAILGGSKTAYSDVMGDALDQLDDPRTVDAVGAGYLAEITDKFKNKLRSINVGEINLVMDVLKEKGLVKKLHRLVKAGTKPKTEYEHLIASRLKSAGDFSSTLKMMGKLISAKTPAQMAKVSGTGVKDLRDMMGVDVKDDTLANWAITSFENLNNYVINMPDHKLIVVKVGLSLLKASAVALLMKTALATVGLTIVKIIAVLLIICVLTDTKATAQLVRKLGIALSTVGVGALKDLIKGFKFLKGLGESVWEGGKSLYKKIFRRAAVLQVQSMLRENPRFRRAYNAL
jgi:hypothetical protein